MIEQEQVDPVPTRFPATDELVRRLINSQFPHWADLDVRRVATEGWDNRTFHLGDTMIVRLPSAAPYALAVEKEHRWLPRLAPRLPLPIPVPLALGAPGEGYPHPWSVYRWLPGRTAEHSRIPDLTAFATDLAEFLVALRQVDAADGPVPGKHNWYRGGPLRTYDPNTREALQNLTGIIRTDLAAEIWDAALATLWRDHPVWFHGDVAAGNLLVAEGRLTAVIDFGTSGVGDPACDLVIAWTLLSGESRAAFRDHIDVDADTWARGRGWALWKALVTYAGELQDPEADQEGLERSEQVLDEIFTEYSAAES